MKRTTMTVWIVLLLAFTLTAADGFEPGEEGYRKMRAELGKLFAGKKYPEAIALIEAHYEIYPDHLEANTFNLAILYGIVNDFKKGINVMAEAQKKGIWFSTWTFDHDLFKGYKNDPAFTTIVETNKKMHARAEAAAVSFFEVREPEGFDREKNYPLFIALHGGDGTIKGFRPQWDSAMLKKDFIVLYVQSSQMSSMNGFHWEDRQKAEKEVKAAFDEITKKYKIDQDRVIIGGFSSGGGASIHMSFNSDIPLKGFIALCPALPGTVDAGNISAAVRKGLSGTILTTEMDNRIKQQRELADMLKEGGFQYQFVVTPDIGHWFPEDIDKKIDQAITHIFSR